MGDSITGQIIDAGPGTRRKDWYAFSLRDGLPSPHVKALQQDRPFFYLS